MTPVWRSVRFCPVDDRANGRKTKRGTETRGVRTLSRVIGFHWSARCRTRASLQPKLPSNEHSTDLCTPYSGETLYGLRVRRDKSMESRADAIYFSLYG